MIRHGIGHRFGHAGFGERGDEAVGQIMPAPAGQPRRFVTRAQQVDRQLVQMQPVA